MEQKDHDLDILRFTAWFLLLTITPVALFTVIMSVGVSVAEGRNVLGQHGDVAILFLGVLGVLLVSFMVMQARTSKEERSGMVWQLVGWTVAAAAVGGSIAYIAARAT